ncbi:hypothetical protein [Streptomyces sp. cmx-18-6]|uniref:hypothetical protein n=1 Tax=Streptomyces sp. cmx-18-6 TaxID=2790930 RepID=UPI00397F72A4
MRLPKHLATAAALIAVTTLSGCGGDSSGPMDDLGLPAADDMASVASIVNEHAVCKKLSKGTQGPSEPSNSVSDQWDPAYLSEETANPDWAIKERALCKDDNGRQITLLTISDMTKFQTATSKAQANGDEKDFLVGQNFAVVPTADDTVRPLMTGGGLFITSCDPDNKSDIPSGYKIHDGLAKGCFMTDYIPS